MPTLSVDTTGREAGWLCARAVKVARAGRPLLDAVDLDVPPGALTMLIGPNGAGKSTLLRVLAGSLRPDAGFVRLDGRPLATWSLAAQAARRAVMPQSMEIAFRLDARQVVALGLPASTPRREAAARVDAALEAVEAGPLAKRFYADCSGGERARLQLARALAQVGLPGAARQPGATRTLLLDEPAASLDPGHQHRLLELLARLVRTHGVGVLVTMHDLNLASQYADAVWMLEDGRMRATGPAATVIAPAHVGPVFGVRLAAWPDGPDTPGMRPVATLSDRPG